MKHYGGVAIQENVVVVEVPALINFVIRPELSVTGCSLMKLKLLEFGWARTVCRRDSVD